jgi:hypothetical protein
MEILYYSDEYTKKVHTFLTENNFHALQKYPTDKDQKRLLKILQQCNIIIDKKRIKYLMQKKPQPPKLKAQIKLHKPGNPIRLEINSINATTYKIAKQLIQIFNRHIHLSNHYNVKNSTTLAHDLTKLKINENHRIMTYDIKDLYVCQYTNTRNTNNQKSMLIKGNNTQITKQIINLLEIILKQNYFSFQNNIYQPEKGVSMGSPISRTIAEIFLQHTENTHIKQIMDTKNIIYYIKYVDDILLIYDTKCINSHIIHEYINQIQIYNLTKHMKTMEA